MSVYDVLREGANNEVIGILDDVDGIAVESGLKNINCKKQEKIWRKDRTLWDSNRTKT